MINNAGVSIRKRGSQYYVASRHGLVDRTWQIEWALYRYLCCFGTPNNGIAMRALTCRPKEVLTP